MFNQRDKEFVRDQISKGSFKAKFSDGLELLRFIKYAKETGALHTVKKVSLEISGVNHQFTFDLLGALIKASDNAEDNTLKIEKFKLIHFDVDTDLLHRVVSLSPKLKKLILKDCIAVDYSVFPFILMSRPELTRLTLDTVGPIKNPKVLKSLREVIEKHTTINQLVIRNPDTLLSEDIIESLWGLENGPRDVVIDFKKNKDANVNEHLRKIFEKQAKPTDE